MQTTKLWLFLLEKSQPCSALRQEWAVPPSSAHHSQGDGSSPKNPRSMTASKPSEIKEARKA